MSQQGFDLGAAATAEMVKDGFHVGFPAGAEAELAQIRARVAGVHPDAQQGSLPVAQPGGAAAGLKDETGLLWSSIDNDTSRDLDQVEVAERVEGGICVSVGIADVTAAVVKGSALDQFAAAQTTTVYTAVRNFPMLPTELSTDLTSLNEQQPRAAIVISFVVAPDGSLSGQKISQALLENKAQLTYNAVGPWLDGTSGPDAKVAASPQLQAQLKLQDEAARAIHANRVALGALEFHRVEADPVVVDGQVKSLQAAVHTRAGELIEDFMIAANETMAETLRAAGRSCIRRVVKAPERWARIVDLVATRGTHLPATPDSAALNDFLRAQRTADPVHYPDLSLAIIKLMGPGEYVLARGDDASPGGHFGLAAQDYTHSTAPNRRYADLVTQRVVKALIAKEPPPYTDDELAAIAQRCTLMESAGRKVERTMQKRVAAVALQSQIGKTFHGVVTGVSDKGTFVRVFDPPVEGRLMRGQQGLDVGDTVDVTLTAADPVHAFIDFSRA